MSFKDFWTNQNNPALEKAEYLYNARHIIVLCITVLLCIILSVVFRKKSQQTKLSESLNKKDSDLFINELNQSNIKIIDNREKSDIIWIIYEEGIQEEVTKLINKYNFKSSFERRGSIVTNNKAAWRVMCK